MSMLKVACEDQRLYLVESTTIASGGVNETRVLFNFCSRWDGFAKTAVFYRNMSKPYYAVVNDENIALIPWEVLKDPGLMYFGVFGIKGGVNRTSEVLTIRIVPGAITAEIAPADPTPDIYIQILSDYSTILERMVAVDQSTAASAAAAKLSADNAKQSENNVTAAETHVGEMETNVETLVNGFDNHVETKTTESKTEIGTFKDDCKTEIDEFTEACKTEIDVFVGEQEGALRHDLRKVAPRNLLDNSDFTNPVNQRENTSYSGVGYCIDRWYSVNNITTTIDPDGLTITNNSPTTALGILQRLNNEKSNRIKGKVVTIAVCESDGNITIGSGVALADNVSGNTNIFVVNANNLKYYICLYKNTNQLFEIRIMIQPGESVTFKYAIVYECEYTIDSLPEYQPKGYGAELAECQRYYQKLSKVMTAGWVTGSAKAYYMPISLSVGMRALPTVISMSGYTARKHDGYSIRTGSSVVTPENLTVYNLSAYDCGLVVLIDTIATAVDTNNIMLMYQLNDVVLSADL